MAQPHLTNDANFTSEYKPTPPDVSQLKKKLTPSTRELLESYSKISPSEVESHVEEIRGRALAIYPYPCIASYRFLDLAVSHSPLYSNFLARLKSGQSFLDLGCCFGQEIRRLIHDGAPSSNIYATDLRPEFWDIGYELFNDKETLKATFIAGDIFDTNGALKQIDGKIDIVYAGSFLHLFGRDEQVAIAVRIIQLLRPVKYSVVFGRQVGNVKAGEYTRADGKTRWRHDEASFREMWKEVGEKTGTEWRVEARILELKQEDRNGNWASSGGDEGTRRLQFEVFRV